MNGSFLAKQPAATRIREKLQQTGLPWAEINSARINSFIQNFEEYAALHEDPQETTDYMIDLLKKYSDTMQDRVSLFGSLGNLTEEFDIPDTKRQSAEIAAVVKQARRTLKEAREIHARGNHGLGTKDHEKFAKLEVELKHRLFDIESLTKEMIDDDFDFRKGLVNILKTIIGSMAETLSEGATEARYCINEILACPERQCIKFTDTGTLDELKSELALLNSVNV